MATKHENHHPAPTVLLRVPDRQGYRFIWLRLGLLYFQLLVLPFYAATIVSIDETCELANNRNGTYRV